MPEIPSPSRGPRPNAVTAAVVLLAILLAVVWLRTGGDAAPPVPAGLPAAVPATVPAAPAEPEQGAVASRPADGSERGVRTTSRSRKPARRGARPSLGRGGRRERARRPRSGSPEPPRPAVKPAAAPAAPAPEFAIG